MFRRLLIANRGEIAVRVIRACRELGVSPAVIYASVDRDSLPVRLADRAVEMGGLEPREAYLDIPRVVEAARACGADALHPGYGFLAENAELARACREAGIAFVGPSPEAIRALGDKNRARRLMRAVGVPVVPGTEEPVAGEEEAREAARRIGYPVLIKAAGGGGGRGMRLARSPEELVRFLPQARSEAASAFGNPSVYLEKYLERPRHVEVQVAADRFGRAVHLFERECSVQRRFQKMFEEAPSPLLDEITRQAMGEAAVRGAQAAGYSCLGTFEFLVDEARNFYFLEVNTRLQVEHPVTEEITGIDLVKTQIRLAAGEPLEWEQQAIPLQGWAMECRITCEDTARNFLPTPGRVQHVRFPAGPGVRVDSHLFPGYTVPPHFDSLCAKLVVRGRDREEARLRALRALGEFEVTGMPTSIPFHRALLSHPEFVAGRLHTRFVPEHFRDFHPGPGGEEQELAALIAACECHARGGAPRSELVRYGQQAADAWRAAGRREALR